MFYGTWGRVGWGQGTDDQTLDREHQTLDSLLRKCHANPWFQPGQGGTEAALGGGVSTDGTLGIKNKGMIITK